MRPLRALAFALSFAIVAGCTFPFPGDGGAVGSAAKNLIDPGERAKLVVEIDYAAGSAPNLEAKQVLVDTIVQISGRARDDIEILESADIPSEPNKKYTLNEIVALENEHRDRRTTGDTAALYVMYVAGGYEGDEGDARVLGVTYRGTSIAIMKANIKEASRSGLLSPRPEERCIERAVLVHEFGHAAGLVNLGTPMVRAHEDPQHQGHSSNKESVMYYAVENSLDLLALFTGGCASIPYQFDQNDLADMRSLRDS